MGSFVYSKETLTLLAADPNCQPGTTTATSVNPLGQAVGYCDKGRQGKVELALYFANGAVRELRRPGSWQQWGVLEPWAINDAGEIYGGAYAWGQSSGDDLARFFANGEATEVFSPPVGFARNVFLNNAGHFAYTNYVWPSRLFAAVGYSSKVRRLFPKPTGGYVSGINQHNYVVGEKFVNGGTQSQTFIHSPSGTTTFLPLPSGITSMSPIGINEVGLVIGEACGPQQCSEIFLYSNGAISDLSKMISPQGNYEVDVTQPGVSDGGSFVARDYSQNSWDVIEPNK